MSYLTVQELSLALEASKAEFGVTFSQELLLSDKVRAAQGSSLLDLISSPPRSPDHRYSLSHLLLSSGHLQ